MCVILQRAAGVEIDFETKFMPAVINNPDGFGMSVVEGGGSLFTIKELTEKPDPEALYKLVQEEYLDEQVMVHLRYTTAGATSMRNLHPFPVLEKKVDGVDMRMAHNGTIHKFKHASTNKEMDWESDTRNFVRSYVRPLFKRLIKGMEPEDLLTDPFVYSLMEGLIPSSSVLSFVDGFGHTLEVNPLGNGGEYFTGWWSSNKYSFDKEHRKPKTPSYNNYYQNHNTAPGQVYEKDADGKWAWRDYTPPVNPQQGVASTTNNQTTTGGIVTTTTKGDTPSHTQSSSGPTDKDGHAMDTKTELFSEKYSEWVGKFEDLFSLSDQTLQTMMDKHPTELLLLTKELMFRCHGMNKALKKKDREHERQVEKEKAAAAEAAGGAADGKVA